MTNHAIADELFQGEYKEIRAAYRVGEGNATIRAACQREVRAAHFLSPLVESVAVGRGGGGGGRGMGERWGAGSERETQRLIDPQKQTNKCFVALKEIGKPKRKSLLTLRDGSTR